MTDPDHPVHFDVNLVEVDAIVTDSHGNHVDNLSADDFEVLEDSKRRQITHFRFVPAPSTHGVPASPAASPLVKSELRRTFVVFLDDLGTSFPEYAFMRRALLKFVDNNLQEGDLWAFFKSTGGSGAWQIFSSDRPEIRSAVEHMKWLPPPPIFEKFRLLLLEDQMTRAIASLGALPGRKVMIFLNSGMPLPVGMGEILQAIRNVSDAANRASVTIESIDLRGLPVGAGMPDQWADASLMHPAQNTLLPRSVIQGDAAPSNPYIPRPMAYMMSQALPQRIAEQTGGLFLHDRNDMYDELRTAENDDAGYYLIGWDPGSAEFLGKRYHNLDIKVHQRGLTVRSRAGFFGYPGSPMPKTPYSPEQQMQAALFSPFRSGDLDVELNAGFQHDRNGSFIDSKVHVAPQGIDFAETSPGCYAANLEIAIMPRPLVFDSLDQAHLTSQMTHLEVCGQTARTLLRDGFVYLVRSKIDRPGPYEMRVAVRNTEPGDSNSLGPKTLIVRASMTPPEVKVGSATGFVEVPDLRKKPFALSGVTMALNGAKIPDAIRTGTEGPAFDMAYRVPVLGDPAVRQFHAGDTITYESRLFAAADVEPAVTVQMVGEARPVHSEPIALEGAEIRGTYHIDPDTPPGRYLLGLTAAERPDKKNTRTSSQWIDFEVVK